MSEGNAFIRFLSVFVCYLIGLTEFEGNYLKLTVQESEIYSFFLYTVIHTTVYYYMWYLIWEFHSTLWLRRLAHCIIVMPVEVSQFD